MTQKPSQMPKNNTLSMKTMTNPLDFHLCYIDGRYVAWFTSIPLDIQWGDDWNDAPYEHNAGEPYDTHKEDKEYVPHHLVKVVFEGPFETPQDNHVNSPWSVERINAKHVPWLTPVRWKESGGEPIFAGTSLLSFIKEIERAGGTVYLPRDLASKVNLSIHTTQSVHYDSFEHP